MPKKSQLLESVAKYAGEHRELSVRDLARKYNVNEYSLRDVIRRMGYPPRIGRKPNEIKNATKLISMGYSVKVAAQKSQISETALRRAIKKNGIVVKFEFENVFDTDYNKPCERPKTPGGKVNYKLERLIDAIKRQPVEPCRDCPYRAKCGDMQLACKDFFNYVKFDYPPEYGNPNKRNPSRKWMVKVGKLNA